jgi:hypothetical protein
MGDNQTENDPAQERLELARKCLIESNRTLDREVAETLRHLAKRYFKQADRYNEGAARYPGGCVEFH